MHFSRGGQRPKTPAKVEREHEIKRRLPFERKVMANLDSISKSRNITLPTKVHIVKAMIFPLILYRCESWTIKKAEHWRTDAFKLFSWTLESPMDSKEIKPVNPKGNQAWIFIGGIDAEAEAPILWPPDEKNQLIGKDWCWERLKVGGEGDDRGWDGQMASLTQWTWVWAGSGRWWRTSSMLHSMGLRSIRGSWVTEQQ